MADALNLGVGLPYPIATHAQALTYTLLSLDDQNDGAAMVLVCPADDTITSVGYRQGTTTGAPATDSYTIGLQGVTNTGLPDGSWLSSSNTTFTPSNADDSTMKWVTLGASHAVTRGDAVALVIQRTAATDASNMTQAGYQHTWIAQRGAMPYALTKAGAGAWTKTPSSVPTMGMAGTKTYGMPGKNHYLAETLGTTTEKGMSFTVPSTWMSTYKVRGIRAYMQGPLTSGAGTHTVNLYSDITGTNPVIESSTGAIDNDISVAVVGLRVHEFYFTGTLPTLTAGTTYGVGISTTTATDVTLAALEFSVNTERQAWAFGEQAAFISRTLASAYPPDASDGAFTVTDTKRPWLELILEDITAPSGGAGGLLTHPGMSGGMRG